MKTGLVLLTMVTAPLGILVATQIAVTPAERTDMTCAGKSLTSYGRTREQITLAEMVGIVRWQNKAKQHSPGFGDWHLARKRSMNCRKLKKSGYYQCVLTGWPCRMNKS